jgi:predicted transcriptional regulator
MSDGEVVRDASRRWLVPPKGGRPKGRSQSELVRVLIEPHRQALIDRALELTKSADPFAAANALRICLERLAPAPKQESEKVEVPGLAEATTFAAKCEAVIAAVASGEISAEAGKSVLQLLDVYRRAHETDALERRIAALESGRAVQTIEPAPDVPMKPEDFS